VKLVLFKVWVKKFLLSFWDCIQAHDQKALEALKANAGKEKEIKTGSVKAVTSNEVW
jgi:hypothetical protein